MALVLYQLALGKNSCINAHNHDRTQNGGARSLAVPQLDCGSSSFKIECEQRYVEGDIDGARSTGYHFPCRWTKDATCAKGAPQACRSLSVWHGCPSSLNQTWAGLRGFSSGAASRWGCHDDGGWMLSSSGKMYHSFTRAEAFSMDQQV